MKGFIIDKEKALNTLLFVTSELKDKADFHKTFKIIYFADQLHLFQYGRPIIGDTYLKMPYGPVPSFIRDLATGKIAGFENYFTVSNKMFVKPLKEPDYDYLSQTDIECIRQSIEENKNLTFDELTEKSHDYAWNNASWPLDYEDILTSVTKDQQMLDYVRINILNNNLVF